LQNFVRFKNTSEALKATTALMKGKMSKSLKSFLTKQVVDKGLKDSLAVADSKLGGVIKEKLGIPCIHDNSVAELIRCIRSQVQNLLTDITPSDLNAMSLGLSHSLSRYKLKFSPDKVDTMIVQAIGILQIIHIF
jgi:nucleolar protein 58